MTMQVSDEDLVRSRKGNGRSLVMAAIIATTIIIVIGILACAATAIILIYRIPM